MATRWVLDAIIASAAVATSSRTSSRSHHATNSTNVIRYLWHGRNPVTQAILEFGSSPNHQGCISAVTQNGVGENNSTQQNSQYSKMCCLRLFGAPERESSRVFILNFY